MNTFSQEIENKENSFNGYFDVNNKDKEKVPLLGTAESYLYQSGVFLQKSAKYRYFALGSLSVSIIMSSIASNSENNSDNSNSNKDICYAASGIFLVSSIVCTIVSINYKIKAGKQLKFSARGGTASIAYIF
jgi:hypothetical protein